MNQVLHFRDIPIHICEKAPKNHINLFDLRTIKSGLCPFCFKEVNVPEKQRSALEEFDTELLRVGEIKLEEVKVTRNGSSEFYKLLDEMAETHDKKSHDYASNAKPFNNYYFAGLMSQLFKNPKDAGFIGRIGEKIYRLANLENQGLTPLNEDIADTEKDILTITALWMASRRERRKK